MEFHFSATECHLPYWITQCYLPPDTSEHTRLNPSIQAGTRFTYPGGMEGWVYLVHLLHTEMVYPPAGGHPSTNRAQCRLTTLIEANALIHYAATQAVRPVRECLWIHCRLTYLISWRSWFSCEQSTSKCSSTSSMAATISSGGSSGTDSPDTERRSERPHHFRTPLSDRFYCCAW